MGGRVGSHLNSHAQIHNISAPLHSSCSMKCPPPNATSAEHERRVGGLPWDGRLSESHPILKHGSFQRIQSLCYSAWLWVPIFILSHFPVIKILGFFEGGSCILPFTWTRLYPHKGYLKRAQQRKCWTHNIIQEVQGGGSCLYPRYTRVFMPICLNQNFLSPNECVVLNYSFSSNNHRFYCSG